MTHWALAGGPPFGIWSVLPAGQVVGGVAADEAPENVPVTVIPANVPIPDRRQQPHRLGAAEPWSRMWVSWEECKEWTSRFGQPGDELSVSGIWRLHDGNLADSGGPGPQGGAEPVDLGLIRRRQQGLVDGQSVRSATASMALNVVTDKWRAGSGIPRSAAPTATSTRASSNPPPRWSRAQKPSRRSAVPAGRRFRASAHRWRGRGPLR